MLKLLKCISLSLLLVLPLACICHKQSCAAPELCELPTPATLPSNNLETDLAFEVQDDILIELPQSDLKDSEATPLALFEKNAEVTDFDVLSEALGHFLVRNLKNPSFEFNLERIILGMQNENCGLPSPLSVEEYERQIGAIQERIFLMNAEKNLEEANAFLEANALKDGVTQVDEKLQYRIESTGHGEEITQDSVPLVHYIGKLLDGTVFVNSHEAGEPTPLALKNTIQGFSKGIIGMKEGEKRTLYMHPEIAFGVSSYLPPNSLLIFDVEVVKANQATTDVADSSESNDIMTDLSFE